MSGRIVAVVMVVSCFSVSALADDKSRTTAAGGDAAWAQLKAIADPMFDQSKDSDKEYVQKFYQERRDVAARRAKAAGEFADQFPDHPNKAEALYLRAESLLQAREPRAAYEDAVDAFVKAAPEDQRGAVLLFEVARGARGGGDVAKEGKVLRLIVEHYPKTDEALLARGTLRQSEDLGKPFELSFSDAISGRTVSVADLKGNVVVIDFWATWCGPCVRQIRDELKPLYAKYKSHGVEFIGVSLDRPEEQGGLARLKEFVAVNGIAWSQYYEAGDAKRKFSREWGISTIPAVFIIDADGKLHSTRARGQLRTLIPELLKKAGKEVTLR